MVELAYINVRCTVHYTCRIFSCEENFRVPPLSNSQVHNIALVELPCCTPHSSCITGSLYFGIFFSHFATTLLPTSGKTPICCIYELSCRFHVSDIILYLSLTSEHNALKFHLLGCKWQDSISHACNSFPVCECASMCLLYLYSSSANEHFGYFHILAIVIMLQ